MEHIELLNMSDPAVAADVWRLQHMAYKIEAELIGYADIPPLRDTIESLRACKETFFGIRSDGDGELIAVIACEQDGTHATICRMMVHPQHHRQGYATKLMVAAERHYIHCETMSVSTGSANEPAVRLYLSRGFVPRREYEPIPGLTLREFIKESESRKSIKTGDNL